MADMMRMEMEGNWSQALDALASTTKEHLLRSGGNAMSEVFQVEAKARAPVYQGTPPTRTKYPIKPGQLRDSIYRAYSEANSSPDLAVYHVSWNPKKAPHGHLLEFGHWTKRVLKDGSAGPHQATWVPAYPYIRPAYEAVKQSAVIKGLDRMKVRYAEIATQGAAA